MIPRENPAIGESGDKIITLSNSNPRNKSLRAGVRQFPHYVPRSLSLLSAMDEAYEIFPERPTVVMVVGL